MRNLTFSEKEFYHIFNRGVDKRLLFLEPTDLERFFEGMEQFNNQVTIGSLTRAVETDPRRHGVSTNKMPEKLVNFIAYAVNPNHFHFILEQVTEKGIERFMHKLSMGYSKYINAKYKRSGALFQGSFKAIHIDSNEYLLWLSAYINLNYKAHKYRHGVSTKSSWQEYVEENPHTKLCENNIILEQFKNKKDYERFALEALKSIVERKEQIKELENYES